MNLGNFDNVQIPTDKVWSEARDSVLLTSSRVMLMLPVWSMGHALAREVHSLLMQMKTLECTG